MQQLNVVYDVDERRTFLRARGLSLVLMMVFFVLIVGTLALVIFGGMLEGAIGRSLGWGAALRTAFAGLRWVVIVAALQTGFALVFTYAPNVERRFCLFTPGTTFATVALLVASLAFKLYVASFAQYDALYGGLGAVIVLLTWLFVAGWVMLVGGEINALLERRSTHGASPAWRSGATGGILSR